jgi:hypothetical protein
MFNSDASQIMLGRNGSPPRQRPRLSPTPFLWKRFIEPSVPLCPLVVKENVDVDKLGMLLTYYRDDPDIHKNLRSLETMERWYQDNNGSPSVVYKQHDYSRFAGSDYRGVMLVGRSYTGGGQASMQQCTKRVVRTLFKRTHYDIDIQASYVSMLASAFRHLDIPFFKAFSTNPRPIYEVFNRDHGLSRSNTKKMINAIISAHPHVPHDYGQGTLDNTDLLRDLAQDDYVDSLKNELQKISAEYKVIYPAAYKMWENKAIQERKSPEGLAMIFLAMDMEQAIMRSVITHFYPSDVICDILWKFDGVYLPVDRVGEQTPHEICVCLSALTKQLYDIDATFSCKMIIEDCFAEVRPEGYDEDRQYRQWKIKYEKEVVMLIHPQKMAIRMGRNNWQLLGPKEEYNHWRRARNVPDDMHKKWWNDYNKKAKAGIACIPPPAECSPDILNIWEGLDGDSWDLPDRHIDISRWMKHVDILTGNQFGGASESASYVHNYIGHLIQYPGKKTQVHIHIRSAPGVGKDVFGTALQAMIGDQLVCRATKLSDICDKNTNLQVGKILVILSEIGFTDALPCMDEFKDFIVKNTIISRQKYVKDFQTANYSNYLSFSNSFSAFPLDPNCRRTFVCDANNGLAADPDYFQGENGLIAWINDKDNLKAIFAHYKTLDISDFVPTVFPKSRAFKEMVQSTNSGIIDGFMKQAIEEFKDMATADHTGRYIKLLPGDILKLSATTFVDHWMTYCLHHKVKNHENRSSMIQFLTKLVSELNARMEKYVSHPEIQAISKCKSHGSRLYRVDLTAFQRYFDATSNDNDSDWKVIDD